LNPRGDTVVGLALDTGAATTLVSWTVAVALGYDPAAGSDRLRIITGSGSEYCPRISVSRFDGLGKSVRDLQVVCRDLPPDSRVRGLLGLNFLRRFDLRINFKGGFIPLR
jgi:predicted aspartyl protease